MAEFEHLTKEKMEYVERGPWEVESALNGLAGLFQGGRSDIPLGEDEWFGMGQVLNIFSQRLSALDDILLYAKTYTLEEKEDRGGRKRPIIFARYGLPPEWRMSITLIFLGGGYSRAPLPCLSRKGLISF